MGDVSRRRRNSQTTELSNDDLLIGSSNGLQFSPTETFLKFMKIVIIFLIFVITVVTVLYFILLSITDTTYTCTKNNNMGYEQIIVTSDSYLCSNVGCQVWQKGGNIADVAVATAFCTTVVNFHSTSIAGGGFLLHYSKVAQSAEFFDFRETAPSGTLSDWYTKHNLSITVGTGSVGVPGFIQGLYEYWIKYGKIPWRNLILPSAKLLEEGFPIPKSLVNAITHVINDLPKFEELNKSLTNPETNTYYKLGEMHKDKLLAETYKKLADDPMSFYRGDIAIQLITDFCNTYFKEYPNTTIPCLLSADDLKKYTVDAVSVEKEAISDLFIFYPPAPSSGSILKFILNSLVKFNITSNNNNDPESNAYDMHKLIEIMKWAFSKHSYLGDPKFLSNASLYNMAMEFYSDPSIIDHIVNTKFSNKTHDPKFYNDVFNGKFKSGTSHISIMDLDGNAVSMTTTTNYYFGSMVKSSQTGIIFNNEMDDFSIPNKTNIFGLEPSINNFVKAGKRPFSSMVPVVITDKNLSPKIVIGASGGSMITTAVSSVLMNLLFYNKNVTESTYRPRVHHQLYPNVVYNDEYFKLDDITIELLKKYGHEVIIGPSYAAVQVVQRDGYKMFGAADPRKDGSAYGI